jgi:hypothetical protein
MKRTSPVWLIPLLLLMIAGVGLRPVSAQDPASALSATPIATSQILWRGRIVSQTEGGGFMGSLIVRVAGLAGCPVEISTEGGWSATAVTGSKPEYGPFACEFAGLSPDSYYITPQGLGVSLWITLKEGETVTVEFAPSTAPVAPTGVCMVRVLNRGYQTVYLTIAQKEYELRPKVPIIVRLGPGTSSGFEAVNDEAVFGAGYWTWNIDLEGGSMEGGFVGPVAGPAVTPTANPLGPPSLLPVTGGSQMPVWTYLVLVVILSAPGGALVCLSRR